MHFSSALALAGLAAAAPSTVSKRAGGVKYLGVNIAGFDFGCDIQGSCNPSNASPPLSSLGGTDGVGQMKHFVNDDKMNIFRLPVGWQFLTNSKAGGDLDKDSLGKYDELVGSCLNTGASCIVDIHNYARWDGKIIGQGGPTNEQFAALWTSLAEKYKGQDKVIFGLMNEPHDLETDQWAETIQAAVTAIRKAGANNMLLLPGSTFSSAGTLPTEAGPALLKVQNPDGTTNNLVFDVHKYLDADGSGTSTECTTNNINDAFSPLAKWLRSNKREALVTETGGGNTDSCVKNFCEEISFLNENADVFLGYTTWSAGAFDPSTYELSLVPSSAGGAWEDVRIVKECMKAA